MQRRATRTPHRRRKDWISIGAHAEEHSRKLAAAAWLYHLGISAFTFTEHRAIDRRSARPLALLVTRDAVLAYGGFQGSSRLRRASLAATVVSDIVALRRMSSSIPRALIAEDRSISQFGLAWGLVAFLDPWRRSKRFAPLAPLAGQAATAALWKFPLPTAARFVTTEAAWSWGVLGVADNLRTRVRDAAIERGEQAQRTEALVHRLSQMTSRSTFYELYVHSERLPVWNAAAIDSDDPLLQRLCLVEIDRCQRFSETEDHTLGQVLRRLETHREIQGLDLLTDDSVQEAIDTRFTHRANEAIDELVDTELSEHPDPLHLHIETIGNRPTLRISSGGTLGRTWSVDLG